MALARRSENGLAAPRRGRTARDGFVAAVPFGFNRIASRAEFLERLQLFEEEFRATKRRPVLHIETHGSEEGIGVSDEEELLWPELMEALILFNRATRLNLVVVLAACHGAWAVKMLQPDRRAAAFRGLDARRRGRCGSVPRREIGVTSSARLPSDLRG